MKKGKHRRTAEKNIDAARVSGAGTATLTSAHFQFAPWHYAVAILLFALVAFQVYGPALHGEFLFDDSYLPFLVPDVQQAPLRSWLGVRPVLMISYWLNYQQSALNPYPYHLVNVLLHVLNSVLVWIIVRRYLAWVNDKGEYNQMLSIFAGLLFLLHPAQTESVAYVASRSE